MWVLPTRGRPDRCQATLDSLVESGVSTEGVVVVDGDPDPAYDNLRVPPGWQVIRANKRRGVCAILNECFALDPDQPWWGFISDDSVVTKAPSEWDIDMIVAAGDDGFASSADGLHADYRMHGAVVFGGALLRHLGWWVPPGLTHSFCDDVWERIGRALGNWSYMPNTVVEHRHVLNGAADDATYQLGQESYAADKAAFQAWLADDGIDRAVAACEPLVKSLRTLEQRALLRALRTSVMICTPVYRDCSWQYTRALVDTCLSMERMGIYHRCQMVIGNSNLPRARNELVAEFLASECSAMIFIDSDMGWTPNDVVRLLASEQPLIGGVGRKRVDKPNSDPNVWCAWFLGEEITQDEAGAVEVGGVGTGFLKIDRSVFERVAAANPNLKRHPLASMSERVGEQFYDFFRFSDGPNGECVGEDFHFCKSWRNLGGSVYIDPTIELLHVGTHDFKGRIADLFQGATE